MEKSSSGEFASLESTLERYRAMGDPAGTARCAHCGHSHLAHYVQPGVGEGCVATTVPQRTVTDRITNADEPNGLIGDQCYCPGFRRGALPEEITEYLEPLTEEGTPCPRCSHPLREHSHPEGCWQCLCEVAALPEA